MKLSILLFCTLSVASTLPAVDVIASVTLEPRGTRHKFHHSRDTRPDFRRQCLCPTDNCPTFLSNKALCECRGAALQACFLLSQRGCPVPSAKVSRHPIAMAMT
ncbi:hypothetical protein B0T24DRAFT_72695 [Lasiosphaeria ovina]|uniref:Extracellular membrane protein CFEM domain-containing protein n=1 Tax=Lasiosphaeria ovina TaxID=92902 RepID=A0AAE0NMI2_9PEZI|nr:hypothetical protein B0T24DRAFT_72695 [Lasiosphaeria ovina]